MRRYLILVIVLAFESELLYAQKEVVGSDSTYSTKSATIKKLSLDSLSNIYRMASSLFFDKTNIECKIEDKDEYCKTVFSVYLSNFIDTLLKEECFKQELSPVKNIIIFYTCQEVHKSLTISVIDSNNNRINVRINYSEGALYSDFPSHATKKSVIQHNSPDITVNDLYSMNSKYFKRSTCGLDCDGGLIFFYYDASGTEIETFSAEGPAGIVESLLGW